MRVAHVVPHHREARPLGHSLDGVADVGQAVPVDHLGDPRSQGLLSDLDQSGALLVDGADRRGERGVAVPAADDGATVDRHDVALFQHPWTGDAVHDDLVGRGADHGRVAVIAEEVRLGSPAFEHVPADLVELRGRHPGTDRRPDAIVHLGHHPAGLAHHRDLVGRLPHTHRLGPRPPGAHARRRSPTRCVGARRRPTRLRRPRRRCPGSCSSPRGGRSGRS